MSEVVGVVIAIGVAIIALAAILTYIQISRFLEAYRIHIQRLGDNIGGVGDKIKSSLDNIDEFVAETKTTVADIREKLAVIERDISPLARNIDKTLTDANPLVNSLSDGSSDIRAAFENIGRVSGDISDITNGLREMIVPTINNLRSVLHGLSEGLRMLRPGGEADQ
jgi:ABC-type transporter Mla subunit MlaD